MPFPSHHSRSKSNRVVKASAAAARSLGEDGPALTPSPRTVIRGESPDGSGQPRAAEGTLRPVFTDWVNVAFPLPEGGKPVQEVFARVVEAVGTGFGVLRNRGRGLHGYTESYAFERGGVLFACGGQRSTGFLSIPGEGCALVPDWARFVDVFQDGLRGHLSRWDGAADDFEGSHNVDDAVELYKSGAFSSQGRKPSCGQAGNWIEPDGSGRTLYVGRRKNGKVLRVYEKGKQLGAADSPWVRWEVELHNVDRSIPWDVLLDPAPYVAGSYPPLSWVSSNASRIETLRRTDSISYDKLIRHGRMTYGPLVTVMLEREGDAESVVRRLARPGVPKRLALTQELQTFERKPK